jgi:hypothetical protein
MRKLGSKSTAIIHELMNLERHEFVELPEYEPSFELTP